MHHFRDKESKFRVYSHRLGCHKSSPTKSSRLECNIEQYHIISSIKISIIRWFRHPQSTHQRSLFAHNHNWVSTSCLFLSLRRLSFNESFLFRSLQLLSTHPVLIPLLSCKKIASSSWIRLYQKIIPISFNVVLNGIKMACREDFFPHFIYISNV